MLLKVLFWLFLAVDVGVLSVFFVLGLAAAGPSKTSPLTVVATMLVVPGLLLAGVAWFFLRTQSPGLRVLAVLLVASPMLVLASGPIVGGFMARGLNGRLWGSTPLTTALRALPQDKSQLATVRALVAQGASLVKGEELPLVLAIFAARHIGDEAVRILLDAGADPNTPDEFGQPAWFAATGITVDIAVLRLLLDRGADVKAVGRGGYGAVWAATNCENWPAALLLLERGADVGGISPMGRSLRETLEDRKHWRSVGAGFTEVLAAVTAREKGK